MPSPPLVDSKTVSCPKCRWRMRPLGDPLPEGRYAGPCQNCGETVKFQVIEEPETSVKFKINGTEHTVTSGYNARMSLNEYIRDVAHLTGTKVMCREGGCGCCVVMATFVDPSTKQSKSAAINSCLCPIYAIDGYEITTTEGIGDKRSGFHAVQDRIAEYNGSQCGFCTPGMVMNMYSLLQKNAKPTKEEVEQSFGGNICRCTGFRPILVACKSFAVDGDPKLLPRGCIDIEELGKVGTCKRGGSCGGEGHCGSNGHCERANPKTLVLSTSGGQWYRPTTLSGLYTILSQLKTSTVRMICGNTSVGVYKADAYADAYIDIRSIPDLFETNVSSSEVMFGGGVSLTTLMEKLEEASAFTGYGYCKKLSEHIRIVASVPVRNAGSWAGNFMMKHAHNDFTSDMFVILEACGAKIKIGSQDETSEMSPKEFLQYDMSQRVVLSIKFPKHGTNVHFGSFKIMPRAENAHAYVNAAFRMEVDSSYRVVAVPSLVYGGINGSFIHASNTEGYLFNKQLTGNDVLQGAYMALDAEVVPDVKPVNASPEYRKNLAVALLYKFVLGVCKDVVDPQFKSGAAILERGVSSGTQQFSTDQSKWPLTKPMPKVASKLQAAGEAQYLGDMPPRPGELHAALVVTTQANAFIDKIDPDDALGMPGVMKFLTSENIPDGGENNFAPPSGTKEELLCSGEVLYAGQPVGIIIADNALRAQEAARKVKITYRDIKTPILTVEDAIKNNSYFPTPGPELKKGDVEKAFANSDHVISGRISMDTQYHFTMETQGCIAIPTEDGMDVFPTTQWLDSIQQTVSRLLNIKNSDVRCEVKRLGGGYGAKITRNNLVSGACALAAYTVNRPVRMVLDMQTNMEALGGRFPYVADYKVGVTKDGKMNGFKITYYSGCGASPNDNAVMGAVGWGDNAYFCENWHFIPYAMKMNTAGTTWTRSPGSVPAIFCMESAIEHVAKVLNIDPLKVKELNLYKKDQMTQNDQPLPYCNIRELVTQLSVSANIATRKAEIEAFNRANRWKKRGLATVPLKYGVGWAGNVFNVLVSIHGGDGSVTISHGGIEMGQGINTKAMQVCAHLLGVDIDIITVRPTEDHANANSGSSGGSITSELCCRGVQRCCETLISRLAPVKAKLKNTSWKLLVATASSKGGDLTARHWVKEDTEYKYKYQSYGVTCGEVELDILTGQSIVKRIDMLFDCGESMNPDVDIGQVEGAFVMGLGYWRSEYYKYDKTTGVNLSSGTWEYKPPVHTDIPVDFRITLLKDAPNPLGVLRSKAVGEPPQCMSCVVLFALKRAIEAARADIKMDSYFRLDGPATVEVAQTMCLPDFKNYVLKE